MGNEVFVFALGEHPYSNGSEKAFRHLNDVTGLQDGSGGGRMGTFLTVSRNTNLKSVPPWGVAPGECDRVQHVHAVDVGVFPRLVHLGR